jgi:hypothetical protein
MPLVTVIGRGHSGTRAISQTLYASGIYMGACLNRSGDLVPPQDMYDACRVMARYVDWQGGLNWDFSALHTMAIPDEFTALIERYLQSVLEEHERRPHSLAGWKIPETTLVYPWISRLYPQTKYIFWIRDPRDSILGHHMTDDLHDFGIDYPERDDVQLRRAASWKYQYDIVKATPRPENWIEVRFKDFVLNRDATVARLEEYLGVELARIPVRPETVGRWRQCEAPTEIDFFAAALAEHNYEP